MEFRYPPPALVERRPPATIRTAEIWTDAVRDAEWKIVGPPDTPSLPAPAPIDRAAFARAAAAYRRAAALVDDDFGRFDIATS